MVKYCSAMLNLERDESLYVFAGKGGVGKTTCAATTALHLAGKGDRILIISTDPSPSLSDIFEIKQNGKRQKVLDNLYIEELRLDDIKEKWKTKFGPEVFEVVSAYIPVEPEFMDYFADAPGIGDEFMLDYIRELVENRLLDLAGVADAPFLNQYTTENFSNSKIGKVKDDY
ncbi:MAG: ArsA-related P-loop ATPase [Dehalococcoidia bacterium]|nr:ArsA-related P-loop ATPase [Dehalococcoidia bacterium]MDZ4246575.1 ArsA-related P-loop ATPase [Dehalococcoidia bacterium]